MHDSKIRPETLKEMDNVQPEIKYIRGETVVRPGPDGFMRPFSRANEDQKAKYNITLDKINNDFKNNWPKMNDKEKMKWKFQRYMQDYLACVSSVDDNVGRVLDYIDKNDLAENTMIIYTSDQGFYLGEHGWFDKRFIYAESFKTPLLIKWPNQIKAGMTNDDMVQNLDFAQTFLEAAQIKAPEDMQGQSLIPLLKQEPKEWKRDAAYYHYYEYPGWHSVKRHYGMVTKEYKLAHFYYDIDEWELYDLKKDPKEMKNVFHDASYSEVVAKLKKQLAALRIKYQDSNELQEHYLEMTKKTSSNTNESRSKK